MPIFEPGPLLGSQSTQYQISRSLRFRSSASAYLSRTPASTTTTTTWTVSAWVKRGSISSSVPIDNKIIDANGNTRIYFNSSDQLEFDSGGAARIVTSSVYRDPSAWLHVVFACNTVAGTQIFYVNGVQVTALATNAPLTASATTSINSNTQHLIGKNGAAAYYADFYLAEYYLIDGSALTPTAFGAFDTNGVWQPAKYTGSYGTNGFYLPFSDNSALTTASNAGIGKDFSGNSNYWVTNNISITTGTTYDSMIDSPTNYADGGNGRGNYATLNPLAASGFSGAAQSGNLTANGSGGAGVLCATIGMTTGKWYAEATCVAVGDESSVGISATAMGFASNYVGGTSTSWGYYVNGNKYTNSSSSAYGASWTTGDTIGIAFDADAGTLVFYKNGSTQGTAFTGLNSGPYYFAVEARSATPNNCAVNFGQRPFTYTPPSGFSALNTQNLPTPTIANGAQYMAATTYAGTGSTQQIFPGASGVSYGNNPLNISFQPDLVWIRNINAASGGMLLDTLRGSSVFLQTTNTNSEGSNTGDFVSFNANGFSVGGNGNLANQTTNNFVGWQWNAGGTTVAGTGTGGITNVSYRANLTAGFSIVKWTGSGAAGTITHGLTTAPTFMIIKERNNSRSWPVWHSSIPNMQTSYIYFDNAGTLGTGYGGFWNSLAPTNSIINVGSDPTTNESAKDFIAFCFTDVSAYSKFGAYTGNGATGTAGSADGPFVYLGFRPRFIIIRRADTVTAGNFVIIDTSRDTYNVSQNALLPDSVNAQSTGWYLDVLSNGFKIRVLGTAANMNSSGITYIYAAFAENPFRNARAR